MADTLLTPAAEAADVVWPGVGSDAGPHLVPLSPVRIGTAYGQRRHRR